MKKLLKLFKNKFVTITVKSARTRTSNMQFVGFFLDEDKDFLYLGEEPNGVVQAGIPKSENAGIVVTDEMNFLMDQIDIPGDQGVQ